MLKRGLFRIVLIGVLLGVSGLTLAQKPATKKPTIAHIAIRYFRVPLLLFSVSLYYSARVATNLVNIARGL